MAATTTRMLLLGAVALFGPVNGYQIRRELASWRVDEWASIKPGSIYHGLATLADRGKLIRHELSESGRAVTVYEITTAGRADLTGLMTDAVLVVNPFSRNNFHTAFAMSPLLGHDAMLALLRRRLATLVELSATSLAPDAAAYIPPVARRSAELWVAEAEAELRWLRAVVDDVDAGTLRLDDRDWAPPPTIPAIRWPTNASATCGCSVADPFLSVPRSILR